VLERHTGWVRSVAWSPDGRRCAVLMPSFECANDDIYLWELTNRGKNSVAHGRSPTNRRRVRRGDGQEGHIGQEMRKLPAVVRCPNPECERLIVIDGDRLDLQPALFRILDEYTDVGQIGVLGVRPRNIDW
jgi:WD40 repeat protein